MAKQISIVGDIPSFGAKVKRTKQKHEAMNHTLPYKKTTVMVPVETYDWFMETARTQRLSWQAIAQQALEAWSKQNAGPSFFPEGWQGWKPPKENG